ncbi:Auxin-induced protein 5NG4 [Morus notabilis]|uniref:Auxin-induced protein 5NG4 n=1 Tax=Morus notabilis TaxID=981085 RepID=W9R2E9_9ROSA|nr:Auxin-induced protein 5NG4 [Morus notabilis]
MTILSKFALNKGTSPYVLGVYRHAIAFAVISPFAVVLERPVIGQNLFYTGMKFTTATFANALWNIVPAFTFVMAWIFRLEKVDIGRVHSQVKVLGTIVTVGGAMVMTLVNGPVLSFPWTKAKGSHHAASNDGNSVKGALMITMGCVSSSCFYILQAITLKAYPAEISLTALICLMGAIEGSFAALALEWHNPAAWVIGAVLIVVGLYMVLSGKSKDHLISESSDQVLETKNEHYSTVLSENKKISSQEIVAVDGARGRTGNESV